VPEDPLATARRFVLGRQGLWPGRRWKGPGGTLEAVRYAGSVQVDPLDVVGHSQDLVLWGRVAGYRAEHLGHALYRDRTLVEWGGNVQIRPVDELPYLRLIMRRTVEEDRWRKFARAHAAVVRSVLREVERRGPLGSREFSPTEGGRVQNYRARTQTGLTIYYLWLKGDLLLASRRRGEKVYDLATRLFPRAGSELPVEEVEEHLVLGTLRDLGLATASEWLAFAHTRLRRSTLRDDWTALTRRWRGEGKFLETEVAGWKGRQCYVADAEPDLDALRAGRLPNSWKAKGPTTEEEAVFLAPLERVSASGRAKRLFDFEYLWEVYKPAPARRWGYYTLPVLYENQLTARIELRMDRELRTLRVLGFWPEAPSALLDPAFAAALGRGLARLADFHRADRIDVGVLGPPTARARIARAATASRALEVA
jgi:uncharacterized protein YcaQ